MSIVKIPNEVFFLIRSYLVVFVEEIYTWNWFQNIDIVEGRKNWNDFLSVSGKQEWKRLRKQLLAVTLGMKTTKRFIDDPSFRHYINGLMNDPYHQLAMKGKFDSPSSLAILELTNQLHTLGIVGGKLNTLPTLPNLNSLVLFYCNELVDISGVNKLNSLMIADCNELKNIKCGIETKLTYLNIDSSVHSIDIDVSNVKSLIVAEEIGSTIDFSQFTALKNLSITGPWDRESRQLKMKIPEIPSLESFHCDYILPLTFNPRQFPHLTSLCIHPSYTDEAVLGNKYIVQLLDQLSGCLNLKRFTSGYCCFPKDFLIKTLPNAIDVQLHDIHLEEKEIILGDKIQIFHITNSNIEIIKGFQNNRRYLDIRIDFCEFLNPLTINQLQNVTRVNLGHCPWVKDIKPLANVPYLRLSECQNIQDFSCLGKQQRFLALENLKQLKDTDLYYLSNVYWLIIYCCDQISDISMLTNNCNLDIYGLPLLKYPTLFGMDYHCVDFQCSDLDEVIVKGQIHHLKINLTTIVRNEQNVNLITRYGEDSL